jgi:hypothetical protein
MSVPLAEAIAGTDTKLDLTISVTINLALGAGLVVSVTWAVIQTRRARRFRNRNKALEGRLLQLQASVDLEN